MLAVMGYNQNQRNSLFFLDQGTKRIECSFCSTGEVLILLGYCDQYLKKVQSTDTQLQSSQFVCLLQQEGSRLDSNRLSSMIQILIHQLEWRPDSVNILIIKLDKNCFHVFILFGKWLHTAFYFVVFPLWCKWSNKVV